jgi:RNA recognition motif-containing protein
MSTMLFVSNLPLSATEDSLLAKFARFGTVLSTRLSAVGQSRRSGFVEMKTAAEAQGAINGLNLADYDGRLISVYVAVAPAAAPH